MKKNLNIIVLALLLTFVASCKNIISESKDSDIKNEYFEGVVEYSIEYKLIDKSISKENLKKYLGTKKIRHFSQGNWRDEYYNDEGVLVRTSILNQSKKKYYYTIPGNDSIYYLDINQTDYTTLVDQKPDTTIKNHECWVVESLSINQTKQSDTVLTKFYNSKELGINPNWYKHYVDGGYNRIYEIAPGIPVVSKYTNAIYIQIQKLVSTNSKKIDESKFKVESSELLKKSNW